MSLKWLSLKRLQCQMKPTILCTLAMPSLENYARLRMFPLKADSIYVSLTNTSRRTVRFVLDSCMLYHGFFVLLQQGIKGFYNFSKL